MDSDELPPIDPNVDFNVILPIHQKRTIAFINHFVMNTVSFLNHFAQSCESRLMEFEYKMQKVEAALLILESQLSSVPGIDVEHGLDSTVNTTSEKEQPSSEQTLDLPSVIGDDTSDESQREEVKVAGIVASKDARFLKFFKMVQFGVPTQAVKNKMVAEGFDPNILDKPNTVIPGSSAETGDSNLSGISSSDSN